MLKIYLNYANFQEFSKFMRSIMWNLIYSLTNMKVCNKRVAEV